MPTPSECCVLEDLLQLAWRRVLDERPPIAGFLTSGTAGAYERAVAFRIGLHLSRVIEASSNGLSADHTLTVDMELHRRTGGDPKLSKLRRPDLIIHERGHDLANLLVVEFKASTNTNGAFIKKDRRTIYQLVVNPLRYRHGARAVFNVAGGSLLLTDWIHADPSWGCDVHRGFRGSEVDYVARGFPR